VSDLARAIDPAALAAAVSTAYPEAQGGPALAMGTESASRY